MSEAHALRSDGFSWPGALLLARASKLAYETTATVERVTLETWGFKRYRFLDAGDTQGFMASEPAVTLIAFQGTESLGDWLADLTITMSEWPPQGAVHTGFLNAYALVRDQVRAFVSDNRTPHLWITGHSLGAALASIAAAELSATVPISGVYTYGQPRIGDGRVRQFFASKLGGRFHRFVNNDDIVSRVPPGFEHVGRLIHFDAQGNIKEATAGEEAGGIERPPLTEQEFKRLQSEIDLARKSMRSLQPLESAEAQTTSLDACVEGLFPSISDHKIDRYIAVVARQLSRPVIESVALSGAEFGGVESLSESARPRLAPVLIRLRKPGWIPPPGLKITSRVGNIVSARAPREVIRDLHTDEGVASLEISRDAGKLELAVAVPFVGGDVLHRPPVEERGDKALIGLIDTGLDVLHRAFQDGAGTSRILAIWDQRDTTGPTPNAVDPTHFPLLDYGTVYLAVDVERFIRGAAPPISLRDPRAHGTHVAGIAAGRAVNVGGGAADGMAPDARLVVVIPNMRTTPGDPPSIGYSVSHVDALTFLRRVSKGGTVVCAEALPMAVNVSLGMNAGAHDGSSALESAFDLISGNGRDPGFVIVKSAGNERTFDGHVRVRAGEGVTQSVTWSATAEPRTKDYIEVWWSNLDELEFVLVDPQQIRSPVVSAAFTKAEVVLGNAVCTMELTALHPDNGASRLVVAILHGAPGPMPGTWQLDITGRRILSRDAWVDAWVERDEIRAVRFDNSDNSMTLSIPGTARSVITVGACNMQLRLTSSSSWGLTRDGRPKPDVCAPGEAVLAARAGTTGAAIGMTGTSMAAPMVTGTLALVLSRRHKQPGQTQWNARQLQAGLIRSTRTFTGVHSEGFGYGSLDAHKFYDYFFKPGGIG